ncbi:MAG: chemotaxis protein CheA [Pseudomonadota bacterium]
MVLSNDAFVGEAEELLTLLEERLLALEEAADPGPEIDAVFRALHTLKGSGDMFGFSALAGFVHHFESAFEAVRAGTQAVTPDLLAVSLASRDHLAALLALGPTAKTPAELQGDEEALLARLAGELTTTGNDGGPPSTTAVEPAPAPAASRRIVIEFTPTPEALRNGFRPDLLFEELAALGALQVACLADNVPPIEDLEPMNCHLSWSMELVTAAPIETVETVFIFVDDGDLEIQETPLQGAATAEGDPPAPLREALRSDGTHRGAAAGASTKAGMPPTAETGEPTDPTTSTASARGAETLRVQAAKLDELMDQLGELVIGHARLRRVAGELDDPALTGVSEEIERLVTGLRDTTLSIRMLPIGQAFNRFRRVVRDLSRELGKPVTLKMSGGETEVDKNVLDSLGEPLVHLVRNAIDHGIEDRDRRLAAGKPAEATITLAARQAGGEVLVSVGDDGGGLNTEAIRQRAIERGLVAPDADLGDEAIHQLIFAPGFSTADAVSALSGRGVGMDAVRRVIEDLRGMVEVKSIPDIGCTVTMRLPLTLAIIEGLLVRVAGRPYVLPLSSVEECVETAIEGNAEETARGLTTIRKKLVPYIDLARHFAVPPNPTSPVTEAKNGPAAPADASPTDDEDANASGAIAKEGGQRTRRIVVVHAEGGPTGLVIDEIIGQHQTVIKPLSAFHSHIPGLAGCTILGDGTVALIIDPTALVKALGPSSELAA